MSCVVLPHLCRPISPGLRFNDAKLLGFPWLVVIGKSFEKVGLCRVYLPVADSRFVAQEGKLEVQRRGSSDKRMMTVDELIANFSPKS